MIYIVLGTDKSGTSMLSSILHESGIPMCKEITSTYDNSYKLYEDKEVVDINSQIIKQFKLSRFDPSHNFNKLQNADLNPRIIDFLKKQQCIYNYWGMKDPRLVTTLIYWIRHITKLNYDFKIISIYRKPLANIRRQIINTHWSTDKSLDWWNNNLSMIAYYLRLIKQKYWILMDYDYIVESGNIKPLEIFIDKKLTNTINKNKRHYRNDIIPDKCHKVWFELERLNNYA